MNRLKEYLSLIIAGAAVLGVVSGGLAYFAKASELKLVELRLDQKIVADQLKQVQSRTWTLEDRNQGKPCSDWKNEDEKTEYRTLKNELEQLKDRQKELMKK